MESGPASTWSDCKEVWECTTEWDLEKGWLPRATAPLWCPSRGTIPSAAVAQLSPAVSPRVPRPVGARPGAESTELTWTSCLGLPSCTFISSNDFYNHTFTFSSGLFPSLSPVLLLHSCFPYKFYLNQVCI